MVNPFFHPYVGGIEEHVRAIGARLSKNNEVHIVTCLLPGTEPFQVLDGMQVHRLPSRFFHIYTPPASVTWGLRRCIAGLSPDLIHAHHRWSPEYARAMRSFLGQVPLVLTWHNDFGEGVGWQRPLSLLNDELFKAYFARHCARIICISEYIRSRLLGRGIHGDLLRVIHNGVDIRGYSDLEEDFILYVGRLVQTKGLDVLAKAMEGVRTRLLVCGKGPLSSTLKGLPNVELLGHVPEEEKNRLLERCKFLVLPSRIESFGLVLLEAMAHGKPVVATRVGGVPEVVGEAGMLVDAGDSVQLRDAMNTLLSDEGLRRRLGQEAWKRAGIFSWDRTASQVEEVYHEILTAR
jgi:glycosyltransferase involved in cell wall biosynthesis